MGRWRIGWTTIKARKRTSFEPLKTLYDERGMKGISAAAVAKEAGYSRSSFYRVFDSVYDVLEILEARAMSQAPL